MGNFYVNFSIKSLKQEQIVNILQREQRVAVVTPCQEGYIVVYDQEAQTQAVQPILDVGSLLSQSLSVSVLAVLNHDDDVLCYWLFDQGELVDSYDSQPDYFDGVFDDPDEGIEATAKEQGGNPEKLCSVLKPDADLTKTTTILREKYLFAIDRHRDLAEVLGLPSWSVGVGYDDVEELKANLKQDDLIDLEGEEFVYINE